MLISRCYETGSPGLESKGVGVVVDCPVSRRVEGVSDIERVVEEAVDLLFHGLGASVVFESSESIGYTHTLHRFRVYVSSDMYVGVRVVVRGREVTRMLFTIPRRLSLELRYNRATYDPSQDLTSIKARSEGAPPGQVYIDIPIVYAVLGVPRVDIANWKLTVDGLVERPLELSLADLYELGVASVLVDFHCVTGWSVKGLEFAGVPVLKLVELAKPLESTRWVYVESLDGYSTIMPVEDFLRSENLVALEMNGRPLHPLHGYPARLLVPSLYGWKSAKWVKRIHFTDRYIDGYWEALGYHPRGRVDLEERFKTK